VIGAFGFLFMFAQGTAIFGTAWLLASALKSNGFFAKIAWMVISYIGWVTFTFILFWLMGADIYIIAAAGAVSAILPSALFAVGWLAFPYLTRQSNG
jgi:hypothetical protein